MVALILVASSCGNSQIPVDIKEETFYTLRGADGAHINHLFSNDTSDISLAAWNQISEGMTCVSSQGIADFKSELEKLCSEVKCNQAALDELRKFFHKVSPKKLALF